MGEKNKTNQGIKKIKKKRKEGKIKEESKD